MGEMEDRSEDKRAHGVSDVLLAEDEIGHTTEIRSGDPGALVR